VQTVPTGWNDPLFCAISIVPLVGCLQRWKLTALIDLFSLLLPGGTHTLWLGVQPFAANATGRLLCLPRIGLPSRSQWVCNMGSTSQGPDASNHSPTHCNPARLLDQLLLELSSSVGLRVSNELLWYFSAWSVS